MMDVMEDGNLMDKITILIQRDMEYYTAKQSILQEPICAGVVGGRLDFPQFASFAAVKVVMWWEDEFVAGFRRNSGLVSQKKSTKPEELAEEGEEEIVKNSDPGKFANAVIKSAEQLLAHLHVLTQEALDHADLTVLIGTIGAAALLKNCLWHYNQQYSSHKSNKKLESNSLKAIYKKYNEMGEALAERLLDLHCRLLSLYILQDADCLHWEDPKPFFESERGSYVIQMWWHYMQATRLDLWNTLPPKMAQRVLEGMLNECLTILTVRYGQSQPTESRTALLTVDISNLLLCIAEIFPSLCNSAEAVLGLNLNFQCKLVRDVHAKCQELLYTLLLRGAPLTILHKMFRKGLEEVELFKPRSPCPSPWIVMCLPHMFPTYPKDIAQIDDLPDNVAIALEMKVLLAQPQPHWALLLKVLCMRKGRVLKKIFELAVKQSPVTNVSSEERNFKCSRFLCASDGSCKDVDCKTPLYTPSHYYNLLSALAHILLSVGGSSDLSRIFLPAVERCSGWAECFDRRQVWNLNHPAWYKSILELVQPVLQPIASTVIGAIQTGATMFQAMTIVIVLFTQLFQCIHSAVPCVAFLFQEQLPPNIIPLQKSALLQILVAALYAELQKMAGKLQKKKVRLAAGCKRGSSDTSSVSGVEGRDSEMSCDLSDQPVVDIILAVAEALCSIDEDCKHTEDIDVLLKEAKKGLEYGNDDGDQCSRVEETIHTSEVLVSDLLLTSFGKTSLKVVYHFLKNNSEWLLQGIGLSEAKTPFVPNKAITPPNSLLHTMFHIGHRPFDQMLTGEWKPDWNVFLQIPVGLNIERVWGHVSLRWEFKDVNAKDLSSHDREMVLQLVSTLKPS